MCLPILRIILFVCCLCHEVFSGAAWGKRREDHVARITDNFGGPHGNYFDDFSFVNASSGHRRLAFLTIGPCTPFEHITYIAMEFKDFEHPELPNTLVEHGKLAKKFVGKTQSLKFEKGDYITTVSLRSYLHDVGWSSHTRIGLLHFEALNGGKMECGLYDVEDSSTTWSFVQGQAFLYFSGASGAAIDNLTGHFINSEDY